MIKTFPIVMSDTFHEILAKAAEKDGLPIKTFIIKAIEEKIEKQNAK